MAVPPSSVGARFRQRKISVKQTLQILRQSEVPDLEKEDQQRELQHVETGVEKHEETEVHLQRIMASQMIGDVANPPKKSDKPKKKQQLQEEADSNKYFIPTPDASKLWKDAKQYYTGHYKLPNTYLKTSATVEDTEGIHYCMDEQDDEFLKQFNENHHNNNNNNSKSKPLSEDEFELIVDTYETIIDEKQPFITIDPTEIMSFDRIKEYALSPNPTSKAAVKKSLKEELHVKSFITVLDPENETAREKTIRSLEVLLKEFGQPVYDYWKDRRISRGGKPILPPLKFEDPADKNNDDDPYVCFRRREFRQQRKTRKTDLQSAEKLRRLHMELKSVKMLVSLVSQRELKRQESLKLEKKVFEDRCKVKSLKRELGIKGEEEDLVQHKKKKIIVPPPSIQPKEEDNKREKLNKLSKSLSSTSSSNINNSNNNNNNNTAATAKTQDVAIDDHRKRQSSTHITAQPYVKLPASKIPDIELETVNRVLTNKNNSIERLVNEKLRQRQMLENNADWINLTDDSLNPFFELSGTNVDIKEYSHLPYSSIVSSLYEVRTTNYLGQQPRYNFSKGRYEDGTIGLFDGVDGKPIHNEKLHSLLDIVNEEDHQHHQHRQPTDPIKLEYYSPYDKDLQPNVSDVRFRLRKRIGRGGRVMVDRRGLIKKSDFQLSDFIDGLEDDSATALSNDTDGEVSTTVGQEVLLAEKIKSENGCDVYDSQVDEYLRHDSRWRFDSDFSESMKARVSPFGVDPSKLNCISNDTQSIRFGSMLLSKAYDSFRDAQYQRQQMLMQTRKKWQLMQQQRLQQRQAQQNGEKNNNNNNIINNNSAATTTTTTATKNNNTTTNNNNNESSIANGLSNENSGGDEPASGTAVANPMVSTTVT
ncbi:Epl1 protein [Saccharomycopsis crataegensis]|uniref:Enhancer of polycomb-like protein n=1 Tax=Saccharomycopsis crataegensis TaxID=43959 RepID=A0AAV5QM68_9ASCO|nr:Epl1 protein [Saccharomycopsis crataegensis]